MQRLFFLTAFLLFALPASASAACNIFQSGTLAPVGFGAAWNTQTFGRELLLSGNCSTAGSPAALTVGTGNSTHVVYKNGYYYQGSWKPFTLSGAFALNSTDWLSGKGTYTLSATPSTDFFWVGYICQWQSNAWKCGCRDSACTTNYWQLQGVHFPPAGTGGTTGGSTSGGSGYTGGDTGFVKVAKSQCLSLLPNVKKPFSPGVHTGTDGTGAAFSIQDSNATIDLRGVTLQSFTKAFSGPQSILTVNGQKNVCILGGRFVGIDDPYNYYWHLNHGWSNYNIGFKSHGGDAIVENAVIKNAFQDSVNMSGSSDNTTRLSLRGIWMIHNDDDWLQNDGCKPMVTLEDMLIETRQGLSMRHGADSSGGCPTFKFTFKNSIIDHRCVKGGKDGNTWNSLNCPESYATGQPFKLDADSMKSVSVEMENVLIRVESVATNSWQQYETQQLEGTYKNVVLFYDPKVGDYTEVPNLPPGWRFVRGQEGRDLWDAARKEWLDKHGCNEQTATCTFPNSY